MMIRISLLTGATAAIFFATPAAASPERLAAAPTIATACTGTRCAAPLPAACLVDAQRPLARACTHSARDVEELGRQQLDQLIASLN